MFNKNLKNIRLKQGLSQKQVSDYLNITPQSISKWEKNEALPSIEYLPKLADILKCEINDFFIIDRVDSFDLQMLKDFFEFMFEHVYEETKKTEDFIPFLKQYPDILNVIKKLGEKIKEHQLINPKKIQGILDCSDEESSLFTSYFLKCELIEKVETGREYFVVKSNFDGLVILVRTMIEACELIESTKALRCNISALLYHFNVYRVIRTKSMILK